MRRGFTIVEILIVVTVLAILASLTAFGFLGVAKQSRDNKRVSDIAIIQTELNKFYDANSGYPSTSGTGGVPIEDFYQNVLQRSNIFDPSDAKITSALRRGSTPFCAQAIAKPNNCIGYYYISQYCNNNCSLIYNSSRPIADVCNLSITGLTPTNAAYILAYYNESDNTVHILKETKGQIEPNVTLTKGADNPKYPNQQCVFSDT